MCLFKNVKIHPNFRPLRAKSDIVCFKILIKTSDNRFITPVQRVEISPDCLYHKQPLKASILSYFRFFKYHILGKRGIVTDGFIHTHETLNLSIYTPEYYTIFKCVIPKGTRYYRGLSNQYASRKIIFLEQLI
jgi:hypothetical protein